MTWEIVVVLLVLVVGGFVAFFLWERRQRALLAQGLGQTHEEVRKIGEKVGNVAAVVETLEKEVGQSLSTTVQILQGQDQTISSRLSAVQGLVADLRERLGKVEEIGRRVGDVAEDLAGLQELLRGPKARGVFGEWVLTELLAAVLPRGKYKEQYRFHDGSVVDAAIFLEEAIVPVDAKFPISGFEALRSAPTAEERKKLKKSLIRSAQRHVDDIAQKYIKPNEGTTDFALMYIPAEGVFLELLLPEEDMDFLEYAWNRRVFPCSPNSFYSYLRAISMGLRGLELAKNMQTVLGELRAVEHDLQQALKELETLGNHLRNAQNKWEETDKKLRQVQNKLSQLAQKEGQ